MTLAITVIAALQLKSFASLTMIKWNLYNVALYLAIIWIFPFSQASYLDFPRIHFNGYFRADAATGNNERCAFNRSIKVTAGILKNWNYIGTNEFSIQSTFVTGVTTSNGDTTDTVIGASVLDSANRPFAKLVDIDVDWQSELTAVYGMMFRIVWSDGVEAIKGKLTTFRISQFKWKRMKCYQGQQPTFPFGSLATTTITNIEWGELRNSLVLKELKQRSPSKLQVSFSLSGFTRGHKEFAKVTFTLGLITGTIGIGNDTEPLSYGGERLLSHNGITSPPDTSSLPSTDECHKHDNFPQKFQPWMFHAPFKVNESLKVLSIDLSNSLPINLDRKLRYINPLYAGIMNIEGNCIELLGPDEIPYCGDDHSGPYCSNDWFKLTGGIADIKLTSDQIKSLQSSASLVMVLMQDMSPETKEVYPNCGVPSDKHKLKLMLAETEYYIRPLKDYAFFFHPSHQKSVEVPIIVSRFGMPKANIDIKVVRHISVLPIDGMVPIKWSIKTESNGIANFTFIKNLTVTIESLRRYIDEEQPCLKDYNSTVTHLPIDGQVYTFKFCRSEEEKEGNCAAFPLKPIAIRAFSEPTPVPNPTWNDDIQPIFAQFHHLYPVMHGILNLSDYSSVTSLDNLHLINLSMSLDVNDPNYMPVSRDLPETQRQMILRWIRNEINGTNKSGYLEMTFSGTYVTPEVLTEIKCIEPKRAGAVSNLYETGAKPCVCQSKAVPYNTQDYCKNFTDDYYFHTLKHPKELTNPCNESMRPLFRYKKDSKEKQIQKKCNFPNLQNQLQIGLQLELATIPLYATSLYSIADGCNMEVSKIIRSILMQEMLHMTLVGNVMNAMKDPKKKNEKKHPLIDSPDVAPVYPTIGLPGCVQPSLRVYLSKASLRHIYEVLQVVEEPHLSCVVPGDDVKSHHTVGEFYNEISDCITELGDSIFEDNEGLQVSWPWTPSEVEIGKLWKVNDAKSALNAIKEIVEQGEGASPINPNSSPTQYGHYYRLMEIVCQKKLKKNNDTHYSYTGEDIPFDTKGVWPMRANPSKNCTTGNCYTEARAFHTTYRRLLRELQATFNGEPDRINLAVGVMESLLVHAKRVMRVPLYSNPALEETCGPVWDYEWPIDHDCK